MSARWNRMNDRRARQKGFALILTSLMMVFIVSLMGMAVDAGVLFAIRGRLSSAVDAAALAARPRRNSTRSPRAARSRSRIC